MASSKKYVQNSKNSFLMLVSAFGVLVVGAAAMILNNSVNYKTGASNVDENMSDKLVKRGTSAFSPCKDLNIKYTYALLGNYGPQATSMPKDTGKPVKPSVKPENTNSPCTPLVVTAALADPFVGKRVVVTGTFTAGVFYATGISDANTPNASAKPVMTSRPTPVVTTKPSSVPKPSPWMIDTKDKKPSTTPNIPPPRY